MDKLSLKAFAYLDSLSMFGWKLGLDRMLQMADELGGPQNNYKIIHVAGTNGKGSVARMLTEIYQNSGRKVGLYTSPHLVSPMERIRINSSEISAVRFESLLSELSPLFDRLEATYFEAITVLAFLYFAQEEVDLALIEVGLGGRFDATNICNPICSCITSISFDHVAHLGDTITKIAGEKAGIIKANTPCVIGHLPEDAKQVIRERCAVIKSELIESEEVFANIEFNQTFAGLECPDPNDEMIQNAIVLGAIGLQQVSNARTAMAVVDTLQSILPCQQNAVLSGLRNVRMLGRFQIWSKEPLTILDVAHNEESMSYLVETLSALNGKKREITYILGLLADKKVPEIIDVLAAQNAKYICVSPKSERALPANELNSICIGKNLNSQTASNINEAYMLALKSYRQGNIIVVTGSHFVVGEFLENAEGQR